MARNTRTVLDLSAGPLAESDLEVLAVTGREAISEPFRFEVEFRAASPVPLALDTLIGQGAQLSIRPVDGAPRIVHGIVEVAEMVSVEDGRPRYRASLVPRLALLDHGRDSRIHQGQSVPEIVKRILGDRSIDHADALRTPHPPREYTVQYRESDLDFASRLLEEEGVFYWFEHAVGRHTLTLVDENDACGAIGGDPAVPWRPPDAADEGADQEHVFELAMDRGLVPDRATLRDFDFERPALDLTATSGAGRLEDYAYPGGYVAPAEGSRLARQHLEALAVPGQVLSGASTCSRLVPGCTFEVVDHPDPAFGGELLLVAVVHEARQAGASGLPGPVEHRYGNRFVAVPKAVPYRPARRTRRRFLPAAQTATVVGAPGEEIHDDVHQRIKVQFHWDRKGRRDEGSSCWVRVAQRWAGAGYGASYVPRVGQEVLVRFVDGDPDRPLVTGAIYNGENASPIELPRDRTQSTLRSDSSPGGGGTNEVRFEDQAGAEEFALHAEKDEVIEVENDKTQRVGAEESLVVDRDRSIAVHQDQSLSVVASDAGTVGGAQSIRVARSRTTYVAGRHEERVAGSQAVTVGGARAVTVGAASATTVGAGAALTVGAGHQVTVGGVENLAVGGLHAVEVGGAMTERVVRRRSETVNGDATRVLGDGFEVNVGGGVSAATSRDLTETVKGKAKVEAKDLATAMGKRIRLEGGDELRFVVGGQLRLAIAKSGTLKLAPVNLTLEASAQIEMKGATIAKSAPAPTIAFPPDVCARFAALWGKSLPGGNSQENGGTLVRRKDGTLAIVNEGAGNSGSFPPNLAVGPDDKVVGIFHTHPYSVAEGGHTNVSLSGGDAGYMINTGQDMIVAKSGDGLFVYQRTAATPANVNFQRLDDAQNARIAQLKAEGKSFSEASQIAARETAKRLNLNYYEGTGCSATKVD